VNASAVSGQHAWAIDETGMLKTTRLDICNESEIVDQEIKEINAIAVPEDLLQIHGYAPPKKSKGTVRLVYKNVNGFNNHHYCNQKVERSKEIHDELKVDIAAYCKHKLNMRHKKNRNGLCVCVFLAPGYGWGTVMHEIPISSSHPLTSLPYPRTQ
jgi:hypothetical protein